MRKLIERLKRDFRDKETRDTYCDEFLNAEIATQIKVLREQQGLTQAALAELAKMAPERISVLEDVNYSSWTINVLRRLAKALDLRLSVKFESFGSFLPEFETFSRETLERPKFDDDLVFHGMPNDVSRRALGRLEEWQQKDASAAQFAGLSLGEVAASIASEEPEAQSKKNLQETKTTTGLRLGTVAAPLRRHTQFGDNTTPSLHAAGGF